MTSDYTVSPGIRSAHADDLWDPKQSNLVQHAEIELKLAGLLNEGSDYDGMLGQAVMELQTLFASQGHSGGSAAITIELFNELARFKALGALTDSPEEWMEIHDGIASEPEPLWQSRRNPEAFSHDGGKTYYLLSDPMHADGNLPIHYSKEHASAE